MSISSNYLLSLYSGSSGSATSGSLLSTAYGIGGAATGSSGTDPVAALNAAETNQASDVKQTAAQPQVRTVIAQFNAAVNKATSVKQLLANPAVLNVLLTAGGMTDQIGSTALAIKVLTSNLKDPNSLANQMTDTRWKTLAQTYDFNTNGLQALQNPKTLAAVANGYAQITWENSQDTVTPGLSNALAFIQQAGTVSLVDQILGNGTLRTVITGALGIPAEIAVQSLDAQEKAITSQLDISRLKDPKFVQTLAQQYLINNNDNSSSAAPSAASSSNITNLAVQAQGNIA